MFKKILIPLIFVVVVSAIYFLSQDNKKPQVSQFLKVGSPYISFSLPDLKGKTINTKDIKGKVLFINFWATWCAPCKEEMPSMQALYEKLNKKYPNQFEMLAVNIDNINVPEVVELYALDLKLKFPILLDTKGTIKDKYKTTGVPETFIIDKKGKIARIDVGAVNWNLQKNYNEIEQIIKKDK
jgi:thiol-disulfide isomerase/thioredoxin